MSSEDEPNFDGIRFESDSELVLLLRFELFCCRATSTRITNSEFEETEERIELGRGFVQW